MADQSSQPPELSAGPQMLQLILGFMATPAISVAATLGIADLVAETPRTAEELTQATNTHGPSLRRLLHFLTSLGVFAEDAAGRYRQTPLSETLRSDHPLSFRGSAILFGSEFIWRPWGDLRMTIATGQPAFDSLYQSPSHLVVEVGRHSASTARNRTPRNLPRASRARGGKSRRKGEVVSRGGQGVLGSPASPAEGYVNFKAHPNWLVDKTGRQNAS